MLAKRSDLVRRFGKAVFELGILSSNAFGVGHDAEVRFEGFAIGRRAVGGFVHEAWDRADRLLGFLARRGHSNM